MNKRYIVRLSKREREELLDVTKRLKGSSQKVRRAQILLKADVRGPNWNDAKISEAFSCRVQTVENLRKRLVTEGFRRLWGQGDFGATLGSRRLWGQSLISD